MDNLDDQRQPKVLYRKDALVDRNIDELLGICRGIVSDDIVNQQEAEYLLQWLIENREFVNKPPFDILYIRLYEMLSDKVLYDDEAKELLNALKEMIGTNQKNTTIKNSSASFPLNKPQPNMCIANKSFVLTGVFTVATRIVCEKLIVELGGEIHKDVKISTDYLIIGDIASEQWIHSQSGRKIERALELRDNNDKSNIAIVSEHHWIKFVN